MDKSYGVHLPGFKELTSKDEIKIAKVPDKVYIPLSQHLGAPTEPIVEIGERVKMGQKIGASKGFISSPVHSSVSGTVTGIVKMAHPNLGYADNIVIENDGLDERDTALKEMYHMNFDKLTAEELRHIVSEAGVVGLGGATFPTHVKYMSAGTSRVEYVILNGGECEPYLTSDHRRMVENAGLIIKGLKYIMKTVGCEKGIIGIEDNKPDAIKILRQETAHLKNIEVKEFPAKYPAGSEKQLIYTCIGKEVPSGKLPLDIGVIVNNVRTAIAVTEAIEFREPLIERVVTVTGKGIKHPANYLVRVGVLLSDLIEESGGYTGEVGKLVIGGPMMGKTLFTDQVPVNKGTSGALVLLKDEIVTERERTCVRCAKCVDQCPMFLEPTTIVQRVKASEIDDALEVGLMDCIECGLCSYGCPARIPLTQYIREGKQVFRARPKK
ncbi:electron transport complex subunit RsxC [Desulfonispora thiosulfatigenes]|nr:electron transport complex subunit RsxC [Desulfonispora thiosulfatigenes]